MGNQITKIGRTWRQSVKRLLVIEAFIHWSGHSLEHS